MVQPIQGFVLPWHFLWLGCDPWPMLSQTLSQQLVLSCFGFHPEVCPRRSPGPVHPPSSTVSGCWTWGGSLHTNCHYVKFWIFTSAASMSSFGQLTMQAGYVMTGRASVLMAWILFLPLSWLFNNCLILGWYLDIADFLASSLWFPCDCGYYGSHVHTVDERVNVPFVLGIQLDVIHTEEVAESNFTPELVSVIILVITAR